MSVLGDIHFTCPYFRLPISNGTTGSVLEDIPLARLPVGSQGLMRHASDQWVSVSVELVQCLRDLQLEVWRGPVAHVVQGLATDVGRRVRYRHLEESLPEGSDVTVHATRTHLLQRPLANDGVTVTRQLDESVDILRLFRQPQRLFDGKLVHSVCTLECVIPYR